MRNLKYTCMAFVIFSGMLSSTGVHGSADPYLPPPSDLPPPPNLTPPKPGSPAPISKPNGFTPFKPSTPSPTSKPSAWTSAKPQEISPPKPQSPSPSLTPKQLEESLEFFSVDAQPKDPDSSLAKLFRHTVYEFLRKCTPAESDLVEGIKMGNSKGYDVSLLQGALKDFREKVKKSILTKAQETYVFIKTPPQGTTEAILYAKAREAFDAIDQDVKNFITNVRYAIYGSGIKIATLPPFADPRPAPGSSSASDPKQGPGTAKGGKAGEEKEKKRFSLPWSRK